MPDLARLKHAYARGARIQWDELDGDGGWLTYKDDPWWRTASEPYSQPHRIHPDDEHMAYGPLSSALREAARVGRATQGALAALDAAQLLFEIDSFIGGLDTAAEVWMFDLFLAEMLADEGL
jgi:hypothetical protein